MDCGGEDGILVILMCVSFGGVCVRFPFLYFYWRLPVKEPVYLKCSIYHIAEVKSCCLQSYSL